MTIQKIYQQYRIMPTLAQHQLRVAGVIDLVCEGIQTEIDRKSLVLTGLLHDMGNIIKFDFDNELSKKILTESERSKWSQVQQEFFDKYGNDEHVATIEIMSELNVDPKVIELVNSIGFRNIPSIVENNDVHKMVAEYGDLRVDPFGVVTLDKRLEDLAKRYSHHYSTPADVARREKHFDFARQMEQILIENSESDPSQITDSQVNGRISVLKDFEV